MKTLKKMTLMLLVLVMLLSLCPAALAANTSAFDAHSPLDLSAFNTADYSMSFDNMKYTAEIYADNCELKYTGSSSLNKDFSFKFDVKMIYSGNLMTFIPRLKLNATLWTYYNLSEIYVKIGENRYCIALDNVNRSYSSGKYSNTYYESAVVLLGRNMMDMLYEAATSSLPVTIKCYGSGGYTSDEFTVSAAQLSALKKFYEDCSASGILDQAMMFLPDYDHMVQVTDFNQ